MKKSKLIILFLCGIVFGLAAFPVFAQEEKNEVKNVVINRAPLHDFGKYLEVKIKSGEIDFKQSFKVVLEGALTEDGKLDEKNTAFTVAEGDAKMVEIAKGAIIAINDGGFFGYLRNLGAEKIKFTLAQDGKTFSANIEAEHKDENKAKTTASGINTLIFLVKNQIEQKNPRIGEDEKILINGLQNPNAEGKIVILNFSLPKQTFHEILLRELNKPENNKSSGE